MSLYGSIKEVQNTIEKVYVKLEQRFNENKLISDLWSQMGQDVSQQIQSLHDLPKSFWSRLKKDQAELIGTIKTEIKPQSFEINKDLSLSDCIEKAILSEEVIILKIYVPLIRNLRKNWTGQALDFYIMVKAHIVRIKRVAEAYSGDPIVMQHAALLFRTFEHEIQEPDAEVIEKIRAARKRRTVKVKKLVKPKVKATAKPKTKAKKKLKAEAKAKPKAKKKLKARDAAKAKKKSTAKPKSKSKASGKAKAKAIIQVKAKPKTKSKPKSQVKAKAPAKPKLQAKAKPKAKSRVKAKAPAKPKPKAKTTSKTKKPPKPSKSPISRSKIHRSRPKPRVEKADVRRRRARR